jgi:hypothetical protein
MDGGGTSVREAVARFRDGIWRGCSGVASLLRANESDQRSIRTPRSHLSLPVGTQVPARSERLANAWSSAQSSYPGILWHTQNMNRLVRLGVRRLIASLLVLSVVAMGVPWTVIHAHGAVDDVHQDHSTAIHDLVLDAHLDRHHTDVPQSGEDHVHDCGLFSHHPGVAGSVVLALLYSPAAPSYFEPAFRSAHGHHSPLLRPPART